MSLVESFCHVDDFCKVFEPVYRTELKAAGLCTRRRTGQLCLSKVMTILIAFHQSHYRDCKAYYLVLKRGIQVGVGFAAERSVGCNVETNC